MKKRVNSGIAIALAWPETLCRKAGSWYDEPLKLLGVNKNNYYKVGHAAVVLIDRKSADCHYYDFGRYHSPLGTGRVRNSITDHDLTVSTKAEFDYYGTLVNFNTILEELQLNNACHGAGKIYGAWANVDYELCQSAALALQITSPLRYGPFIIDGTNCSRFVNKVVRAGVLDRATYLRLRLPRFLTPTPMCNVRILKDKFTVEHNLRAE